MWMQNLVIRHDDRCSKFTHDAMYFQWRLEKSGRKNANDYKHTYYDQSACTC